MTTTTRTSLSSFHYLNGEHRLIAVRLLGKLAEIPGLKVVTRNKMVPASGEAHEYRVLVVENRPQSIHRILQHYNVPVMPFLFINSVGKRLR